jgi:hypothetical protein
MSKKIFPRLEADPSTSAGETRPLPAPASAEPPPAADPPPEIPFDPVPVRPRRDGWTAARQRIFIQTLAETGIVRIAAAAAGMSVRSADRLALRDDAESFCLAWDAALQVAARRGAALLYEYAFEGMVETIWRDGEIVGQRRRPSEKALFFLLARLDPVRFGRAGPHPECPDFDPIRANLDDLSMHLDGLRDLPDEEDGEDKAGPADA